VEHKERNISIFSMILLPLGLSAFLFAAYNFPVERLSVTMILLSVVTIFFSSYLKIQLPRTKIHLTVSETLTFFALLYYGGEVAVLLAAFESIYGIYNLRREGQKLKGKTIIINISVSILATAASAWAVNQFSNRPEVTLTPTTRCSSAS